MTLKKLKEKFHLQFFADDEKKSIEYGIEAFYFYPIVNGVYQKGIKQIGARGVTRDVEKEDTTTYADNTPWIIIPGNKAISGEMKFYKIKEVVYQNLLGYYKNKGGLNTDSATPKPFGFAFVGRRLDEDGLENKKLFVGYYATATEPSFEKATKEDATEGEELVIPYSAVATDMAPDDLEAPCSWAFADLGDVPLSSVEEILEAGIPMPKSVLPQAPTIVVGTDTLEYTTADSGITFADIITACGITATDYTGDNITSDIVFSDAIVRTVYNQTDEVPLSAIGTYGYTLSVTGEAGTAKDNITINVTAGAGGTL